MVMTTSSGVLLPFVVTLLGQFLGPKGSFPVSVRINPCTMSLLWFPSVRDTQLETHWPLQPTE